MKGILRQHIDKILNETPTPSYETGKEYDLTKWNRIGHIGRLNNTVFKFVYLPNGERDYRPVEVEPYYDYDIFADPQNPYRYAILQGQCYGVGRPMTLGQISSFQKDSIEIYDEYIGTPFEEPFLAPIKPQSDQIHQQFLSQLHMFNGKVVLMHDSPVKIMDGQLSAGHPQRNYSNNTDKGWYSWASKNSGPDPSNGGQYTYYALISPDQLYDMSANFNRYRSFGIAMKFNDYVGIFWGNSTTNIAVASYTNTPIAFIYNKNGGEWYDSRWQRIEDPHIR